MLSLLLLSFGGIHGGTGVDWPDGLVIVTPGG